MIPPLIALLAWVPISLYCFRRYPIRVALLINFVAGWAVLPGAHYIDRHSVFPYWIMGVSLHAEYFVTKATVCGFTGLLGMFLFDSRRIRQFRLTVWDLPMGMWCLVPLFSAIANGDNSEGVVDTIYHLLAWGSPYLLGRLYFTDTRALRLAAKAFVIGGLAYIPFCLLELVIGPHIYEFLYGYQPFQWVGAQRYIGFRPVGLLEDGNQLGIWMATATLIAIWLWVRKTAGSVMRIPIGIVVAALILVTLLCQSAGAIILLLALAPFVFVDPRHLSRAVTIMAVLGILAFAGLRIANVFSVRDLVKNNSTAHAAAGFLKHIGRGSFGWRLAQDERHIDIALQSPIVGYGEWDWWQRGAARPWGLWLLAFGTYGMLGLAALECLLLMPVLRAVWFPLARSDIGAMNLRHTLAAAVLISAIDSLLNGAFILPLLLVIGGMSYWSTTDTPINVDYLNEETLAERRQLATESRLPERGIAPFAGTSKSRDETRRKVYSLSNKKRNPPPEDPDLP